VYPAIHPVQSTSILLEDDALDSSHTTIQKKAKKLLRRYKEIRVLMNTIGKDKIPEADLDLFHIGERLEAYLSQPFYVAEEFTKIKGQTVGIQQTIQDIQQILQGQYNHLEPKELTYKGKLI
jgi:F-type H+/Na+-transporting ATPase subunit beta